MWCVRETEILRDEQPPQGVLVCDHAGLVTNQFSLEQAPKLAAKREEGKGGKGFSASQVPPPPHSYETEFLELKLVIVCRFAK